MNRLYEFGPYRLDPVCRKVWRSGEQVSFTSKQFDVLYAIVRREGAVAEKSKIFEEVWPDDRSDLGARLARHVTDLRDKLRQGNSDPNYLENVSGQGYFISVPVKTSPVPVTLVSSPEILPRRLPFLARKQLAYVGAVILAISGAGAYLRARGDGLRVTGYRALTNDGLPKSGPLLSDGRRIFFQEQIGDEYKVVSVQISGGDVIPMDIPLRVAGLCDIAADGSALLISTYEGSRRKLWSWPLTGGSPQAINQDGESAGWAPDRSTIAFGEGASLVVASSGAPRITSAASEVVSVQDPRWSPDGSQIGFTLADPKNGVHSLWHADRRGQHRERMAQTASSGDDQAHGTWTADGRYFVYEAGSIQKHDLWVIPGADRSFASFFGKASRVTNGPLSWTWPLPERVGGRIFSLGELDRGELARLDPRTGVWRPYLGGIAAYEIDFSRDGKWITYTRYPENTIWKAKPDGSERVQLTPTAFEAHQPHWSPDGSRIAFMARKTGKPWRVMTLEIANGAIEEPIPEGGNQGVPTWSSDGHSLVFGERLLVKDPTAMAIHVFDERTRQVSVLPGSANLWTPRWSPDGTYVSALRPNGSALLLSRCCFSEWKTLLDKMESLDDAMWSRDSSHLFLMAGSGPGRRQLVRVSVPDGHLERIADITGFLGTYEQWFGLAPDGSALGLRGVRAQEIYALEYTRP